MRNRERERMGAHVATYTTCPTTPHHLALNNEENDQFCGTGEWSEEQRKKPLNVFSEIVHQVTHSFAHSLELT